MPVKINSCCVVGFDCHLVEVEVEIVNGMSSFEIVGLGDVAVQESKQRIYSALKNSGVEFPRRRKIVNLAPADLKKYGPSFDLPMAAGLLVASEQMPAQLLENGIMVGELALSGALRKIRGVLPIAAFAKERGFGKIFVPMENAAEAGLVEGIEIFGIRHIKELIDGTAQKFSRIASPEILSSGNHGEKNEVQLEDIHGQEFAKRSLLIAAAGGHNLLMNGPPGAGKTMLAKALAGLLPPLTFPEALEVTKIYSVAGKTSCHQPLITVRPFRVVHHTASSTAIVGGGNTPHPGEISLAHRGVLFFDELLEFPRSVLEVLRQPLEDGTITVSRASYRTTFPARFMLVAAMNPCPCGFATDPGKTCSCSPKELRKYFKKLSGPLLDRIDLCLEVPKADIQKLRGKNSYAEKSENHATMPSLEKIRQARRIQEIRFCKKSIFTNSEMTSRDTDQFCALSPEAETLLRQASSALDLSARSFYKILKVSRTVADIEASESVLPQHISEALQYRPTHWTPLLPAKGV